MFMLWKIIFQCDSYAMHQLGFSFEILTLLVIILQCEFYNGLQNEYNNSNDLQDIQRQQTDSYLVSSGNRHVLNKRAIIFIKRIRKFRRLFISTCCGSESQTLLTCKRPIRETSTTSLMSSVITRSIATEDTTEESDTDPPATAALSKAVTSAITTTMKITDTVTITTTVIPSTSTTITTTTTVPTTPTTTPTTMTTIPTTTTTTTPTTTRCKAICPTCSSGTDLTLLNSDGSIKDPSSYGTWITACNTLYLLSKDQATNEVATNKCCKLGMELWSFENEKELQCVYTANNVGPKFDNIVFWTSLTDQGCTDNGKLIWTWCRTQSPLNQSWWIPTQPDNLNGDETCATIVIKNVPAIPAESMNDIKCDKSFNYICQGPTTTSTSTTTTPPPATTTRCMASCPACGNKDSSLFNTDGSLINPSNYGSWLTACDNLYLFSNDEKSNADASGVCCRLGMQLWSIESQAEMQCIHDANFVTTKQSGTFWLSLTDVGCTVNGKLVWTWCRTQNGLGASWWRGGEPNNDGGNEECGTIEIVSQQALPTESMNDIACSKPFKYVCQGTKTTTTTATTTTPPPPTTTRCMASCPACGNKDTSLFNTDGSLINPSNYGSWLTACNTLYLFSNDAKSNADAAAMCCKLGMQLWSIESQVEMQCIHDANFATTKLSERYWLSLTDVGCTVNGKLVWTWCRTQNGLGASWWFAGEPNNDGGNEECGTIDIASQQSLPATSMNDIACSKPFKYVCQGTKTTTTTATTTTPPPPTTTTPPPPTTTRCMASCPACGNKDTSLFNTDGSLINPSNYGSWLTACNTLYLFSNDAKSNADAAAMCCKLGMQLWSIESQAEMQCIHDANFATTKLSERYWLSLTDVGCTVNGQLVWTWCRTQNGLGASWWFSGEPNNAGGDEQCGTIDIALQQSLPATSMNDIACSKPFKYVCQGPPTPSSGRK